MNKYIYIFVLPPSDIIFNLKEYNIEDIYDIIKKIYSYTHDCVSIVFIILRHAERPAEFEGLLNQIVGDNEAIIIAHRNFTSEHFKKIKHFSRKERDIWGKIKKLVELCNKNKVEEIRKVLDEIREAEAHPEKKIYHDLISHIAVTILNDIELMNQGRFTGYTEEECKYIENRFLWVSKELEKLEASVRKVENLYKLFSGLHDLLRSYYNALKETDKSFTYNTERIKELIMKIDNYI